MRVAFVTQWFPPEVGSGVPAGIAECIAAAGHQVDVLTGFPNYPTGRLHPDYPLRPYRRQAESSGLVVHRAPLYPSHDGAAVRRGANYLSFAVAASVVARLKMQRPDAWLVYSSPATAALPVLNLPSRLDAPRYLLIQDLWPDSVADSGLAEGRVGRVVQRGLARFCSAAYAAADGIGVISPGMRDLLRTRGVPDGRIHYTPNWAPDPGCVTVDAAGRAALRRKFGLPDAGRLFVYAGNVGQLQGLDRLMSAFRECPEAHLVIVGDGIALPQLVGLAARGAQGNVWFVPRQPPEEMARVAALADVLVVSLRDTPLLRATMPSKVQSALAAGRPILAHAAGDVAQLVEGAGAGLAAPPGNLSASVRAVRELTAASVDRLQLAGHAARQCFEREFTEEVCVSRLLHLLGSPDRPRRSLPGDPRIGRQYAPSDASAAAGRS